MTNHMFGQTSAGIKQIADRYVQYPSAPYIHESYNPQYTYDPNPTQYVPSHGITTKHSHHGGHKSNAAMSALTLLAFLFFLHILQQCLKDHMTSMSTPSIVVMTGGREGEDDLSKTAEGKLAKTTEDKLAKISDVKNDKFGQIDQRDKVKVDKSMSKVNKAIGAQFVSKAQELPDLFTKVKLSHHENRRENNGIKGFVSAMTVD